MKTLTFISKYIVTPIGMVIGAYMTVESWTKSQASEVIEPVKIEVRHINEKQDQFYRAMDARMNSMDEKLNILIERK